MTVVVGTAGHIDHGKTSLLRALTGIDADRLPEEQRRGMTIDVGYAHLSIDDGSLIDFVDVPGHDRLIGNMLVGAGEIDAAMLVVAADDGPRAQTIEHLELLDALGVSAGLVVVTKTDLVDSERTQVVVRDIARLLDGTSLAGVPVVAASATTLVGLDVVRATLGRLATRIQAGLRIDGPARLALDRVFSVRGRGVVVTGSLRGGAVARGDQLRVEPDGLEVRVREVQVHNQPVDRVADGGRVALNVAGPGVDALRRGQVLTSGPGVERTERVLVTVRPRGPEALRHGLAVRMHVGTDQVDGTLDLSRRASGGIDHDLLSAIVRLDRPVAAAFGDPFVLRRPSPAATLAGGRILDPLPPRGVSRRRSGPEAIGRLGAAEWGSASQLDALIDLHGALPAARAEAWTASVGRGRVDSPSSGHSSGSHLAPDVVAALEEAAIELVASAGGLSAAGLRAGLGAEQRRRVSMDPGLASAAVDGIIDGLVGGGRLSRRGDRILPAGVATGPSPELRAAMDRLEAAIAVPAPPSLGAAALAARCPIEGIRALEAEGRIVRVEDDLAWPTAMLRGFERLALRVASTGPLTPAAFRDATGTSRRYALAILEDMDRRAVLRRTPAGHVPGPRAGSVPADLTADVAPEVAPAVAADVAT